MDEKKDNNNKTLEEIINGDEEFVVTPIGSIELDKTVQEIGDVRDNEKKYDLIDKYAENWNKINKALIETFGKNVVELFHELNNKKGEFYVITKYGPISSNDIIYSALAHKVKSVYNRGVDAHQLEKLKKDVEEVGRVYKSESHKPLLEQIFNLLYEISQPTEVLFLKKENGKNKKKA